MKNGDGIKQLDIEVKAELLTGKGFWNTAECSDIAMPSAKLSDGPHGLRVQDKNPGAGGMGGSRPATCYPTASAAACSFDVGLLKELGEHIGAEAAEQGVSMLLGPGVNVKRSPLCGRNFEYYSEDSYLSGKLAAAFVQGVQSTGVTACVKHFAANSREYARQYYDSRIDEQTLRETYLTPFEIAVKEGGAGAVMTAYNSLNGAPCNSNGKLINGILRGEWGFGGLVVSDWGGSGDRVPALKAGADLEMPECPFSADEVTEAVRTGELQESTVDDAVRRIRDFAVRSLEIERKPTDGKANSDFARTVAEQSIVLLKNLNGALPLKKGEKVAVIGDFAKDPRYQGAGSSKVNPASLSNIWGEISRTELDIIGYAKGFKRNGGRSARLIKKAVGLAVKADTVIVCLGLTEKDEAEGADRTTLSLNGNQKELLAALAPLNKKIVAVLCCGGSVLTDWDGNADALVLAHLGGQSGAAAVVNVLTGKVNPSGKLAETYLLNGGDEACAKIYSSCDLKMDYAEGIYAGYKYFSALNVPVKYPFGYGLSYTTFAYSDFTADSKGVRFTVENTGGVAGAAVPQIYVKAPRPLVLPPYELKLFAKVFLEAGESREVYLPFDEYSFRMWDDSDSRFVAGGGYSVSLNTDSVHKLFETTVTIDGDNLPVGCAFALPCGEKISYGEYFAGHITDDARYPQPYKGMSAALDMRVADIGYCRGAFAKIFGLVVKLGKKSKDVTKATAFDYMPLRTLLQYMAFDSGQAEGFLLACNGHFFKGVKKILKKYFKN